jgi:2-polyprenyl-6-methoxyphenol hydroxylase-like FAD-dependent oxidoreductase
VETTTSDVVIVGGGIGGSTLAVQLARAGADVTVLERATVFLDRVRGETWAPWGVALARDLGVLDPLVAAGGIFTTTFAFFDPAIPPDVATEMGIRLDEILPGVPGNLNVGHPAACEALAGEATRTGARVVRGSFDVRLDLDGARPNIRYRDRSGSLHRVEAALVVGADGRNSTVRKQAGIELVKAPLRHWMSGLLVESAQPLRHDVDSYGSGVDVNWFSFPQGPHRTRLYLAHMDAGGQRFSGHDGARRFLAAVGQAANPEVARLSDATPVGPVATHPSIDSWTESPSAPGVVLIGDAAGYNDPIIGQGLSLTMADVRDVSRVVLGGGRAPGDFDAYGEARRDRFDKQRLAATIMATMLCSFGEASSALRLRALPLIGTDERARAFGAALLAGPEALPPGVAALQLARDALLAA